MLSHRGSLTAAVALPGAFAVVLCAQAQQPKSVFGERTYELGSGDRLIVNGFGSFSRIPKSKTCSQQSPCATHGLVFRLTAPKGKERYLYDALTVSSDEDVNQKLDFESSGFEGPKPGTVLDDAKASRLAFRFRTIDGQVSFQVVLEFAKGTIRRYIEASGPPGAKVWVQPLSYGAAYRGTAGPVPVLPGCKPEVCPPSCDGQGCVLQQGVALTLLKQLPPLDRPQAKGVEVGI